MVWKTYRALLLFLCCTIVIDGRSWCAITNTKILRGGSTRIRTRASTNNASTAEIILNEGNNTNTTTGSSSYMDSNNQTRSSFRLPRPRLPRFGIANVTARLQQRTANFTQQLIPRDSNTTVNMKSTTSTTLTGDQILHQVNTTNTSSFKRGSSSVVNDQTRSELGQNGSSFRFSPSRLPRFGVANITRGWQQAANFTKRLIHGDANFTANTTLDQDVFVFSSKRGETVKKINVTQEFQTPSNTTTTTLPGPLQRIFGRKHRQPTTTRSSVSSSPYSSWNPFESDPFTVSNNLTTDNTLQHDNRTFTQNHTSTESNRTKPITGSSSSFNASSTTTPATTITNDTTTNTSISAVESSNNVTVATEQNATTSQPTPGTPTDPMQMYPGSTTMPPQMPMYGMAPPPPGGFPPSSNIVFYGGKPYRVVRPGGRGMPPNAQRPSSNAMLLGEVAGALLGTAMRLWFLTWLTRRLAHEEETIQPVQRFVWERINDRYDRDASALKSVLARPPLGVSAPVWRRRHVRHQTKYTPPRRNLRQTFDRTVLVVPVEADNSGHLDVPYLTDMINFLIQQHRSHAFGTLPPKNPPLPWWEKLARQFARMTSKGEDNYDSFNEEQIQEVLVPKPLEVVLLVRSPGGGVGTYGLAAAQVRRLAEEPGILLTVSVDQIAASGGYMIASQAHQLVAAPFATVGSIGVIMEGLNFHEIVRKYGIHPIIIKSGANKNPLSTYGPITSEIESEEQKRLERVHEAFKRLVVEGRPALADTIDKVGDGSIFVGEEAIDLQLVDRIQTSEEYIMNRVLAGDRVLRLHRSIKPKFTRRIHLSPLDVLPHLKSWLVKSGWMDRIVENPTILVTLTSALEMARYLFRQYVEGRRDG